MNKKSDPSKKAATVGTHDNDRIRNMNRQISDSVWNALMCPNCGGEFHKANEDVICSRCQLHYECKTLGNLDLRLKQRKKYYYEFELGTSLSLKTDVDFNVLPLNSAPEVDFSNIKVPWHLTKEILSHFPKAKTDNSLMLDLGCGNTVHREVCELAGYEYVGLDYNSQKAPILGDAHSLPFKDESFEFVLSIAVLEHIRFPFVMMKEVYRVLKTEGVFIGTVAFLEPFHGDSFYHHTHLGAYNSLQEGGFKIKYICPSDKWTVLIAQAGMGLFPKMPLILSRILIMPVQILHKIWWGIIGLVSDKVSEKIRITNTTGAFSFIVKK
jgi:SAM-dependent methyltransferase